MTVIQKVPFSIIERFPNHQDAISRIFRENETFRTICEDYQLCTRTLAHWNQLDSGEAPERIEEYKAVLRGSGNGNIAEFKPLVSIQK